MSAEIKKQPPLLGLIWPYELPLLALIFWGLYQASPEFRGSNAPILWYGVAVLAGFTMLALRFPATWRELPNKSFFFPLAGIWVALFLFLGNSTLGYLHSDSIFYWAFDIYTAPESDVEFALFMPFVILAIYGLKSPELLARKPDVWPPALGLVAGGLLLHLVGYVIQQPRVSYCGFFVGLFGLTGLAWGKAWLKTSWFPFFLVVFCIPPAGTDAVAFRMRLLVSWIVEHIAHLGLATDLVRDGTQLTNSDHTFAYEVAAACSGIRSLTTLLVLTLIYGFILFKSPWKRLIMLASAFPLAIAGNVLRLCFTIVVAEMGGQAAGKAVETKTGFVTFLVALGGVYLLARKLEASEPAQTKP
ncbi:MAG TPA: exosortase/archaeosortase family protein [Verrucomicrobiae bacterium]